MDEEYIELQKILLGIIQANKGVPVGKDDRVIDAESLAVKLLEHSASINYLYKDTIVPELGFRIFDLATLNIISRAIIENFLVFHYVFSEPKSSDEEDFRYLTYWISGLIERQNYTIESPQGKTILERENKIIDKIIKLLETNNYFSKLKQNDKDRIIKKGEWRFKSWTAIALSAGLNKSNSKDFYKFLCGYAHSGSLILQHIHQTVSNEKKRELFNATLTLLKIAIANMVNSYCNYFPKAKKYYEALGEKNYLVKLWIDVGSTEMYGDELK